MRRRHKEGALASLYRRGGFRPTMLVASLETGWSDGGLELLLRIGDGG